MSLKKFEAHQTQYIEWIYSAKKEEPLAERIASMIKTLLTK